MKKVFTKEFMQSNCGCYNDNGDLSKLDNCSFMNPDVITLNSILKSEIPIKDKYWFVCKRLATKEENQQIAIMVAEIVLPIYEKRNPDDLRAREAIEAAKQFIGGHISIDDLLAKRNAAAYAADAAAAYAYAAAYAAADAAYAADAAAAYAAAAAAYAADADDDDAIKQQLIDSLIEFCERLTDES